MLTDADRAASACRSSIFTLDTGRLHGDTLDLVGRDRAALRHRRARLPAAAARRSSEYVARIGRDAFYEQRRAAQAAAARSARSSRSSARSPASAPGSPACAASSPSRARRSPFEECDDAHGLKKFNPLADWSEDEVWDYIRALRRALQPAVRPGLPLDRLRALHAAGGRGRGRARRPLVVGAAKPRGMRPARRAGRQAASGQERARREASSAATSTGSSPRRSTSCARSPASAPTRCCSSPAARTRSACCASRRRRSGPGRFPFPLLHIDTGHNFPEVIAFRDARAAELGERLIVRSVEDSIAARHRAPALSRTRAATPRNR